MQRADGLVRHHSGVAPAGPGAVRSARGGTYKRAYTLLPLHHCRLPASASPASCHLSFSVCRFQSVVSVNQNVERHGPTEWLRLSRAARCWCLRVTPSRFPASRPRPCVAVRQRRKRRHLPRRALRILRRRVRQHSRHRRVVLEVVEHDLVVRVPVRVPRILAVLRVARL
jgi:hypothetical protein